jgi:hypothetical protein
MTVISTGGAGFKPRAPWMILSAGFMQAREARDFIQRECNPASRGALRLL